PEPAPRGAVVLTGLSALYRIGFALAPALALARRRPCARAPIPVVSVGSIHVGGSGKTPLAREIARIASARGLSPALVLRGYRGTYRGRAEHVDAGAEHAAERYGDEAALHAASGARVYVARRRIEGVRAAARGGAKLAILDDGMQHRPLCRDLEMVTVPDYAPLGNGRALPRGPLREPPAALGRADLLVLAYRSPARGPFCDPAVLPRLRPGIPILSWRAAIRLRPIAAGAVDGVEAGADVPVAGDRVGVLCGIARPATFEASPREAGFLPARRFAFADHHRFTAQETAECRRAASREGLRWLVTTEKDAVRIPACREAEGEGEGEAEPERAGEARIVVAEMDLRWNEEEAPETIGDLLERCFEGAR
ncbi:MAG: tetraacyldisaccharide 4'-kinase, partial [Candidatus Eisenbacteria bacterium]|nr:tetraacyldisaccharide 4'-kinase [Candidatus Eisenbacteria bacterium]